MQIYHGLRFWVLLTLDFHLAPASFTVRAGYLIGIGRMIYQIRVIGPRLCCISATGGHDNCHFGDLIKPYTSPPVDGLSAKC